MWSGSRVANVRLLRFLLLFAIAVGLVEVVVAVASGTTGVLEKAVVVLLGLALVLAASRVRRLGAPKPS
jgi:peptidoglycan/LPS O-acetylase OafA/YrhL